MDTRFDPASIPLPSVEELLEWSKWVDDVPGLRPVAAGLFRSAPGKRERAERGARRLARANVDAAMVAGMSRIGGRLSLVALGELLAVAAGSPRAAAKRRLGEHAGQERMIRRAQQLVRAGGPAWVKLGQFVATTAGLLPDEWVDSFAWCRDEVPPFPADTARSLVQRHLGRSAQELFAVFEEEPLAAASIAQVHAATMRDGRDVVVKIRRPGLRRRFVSDIRVMAGAGRVAERYSSVARTGNVSGFVELFAQLVLEELDFEIEAANMLELGLSAEHAGADYVRFPRPMPGMASEAVLVMERLPGISYTLADPGELDRERLLRLAIQGVLEHTLVYGVFHGDLHAGNVLLDETGTFSLVDFGIVGRLDQAQRAALVRFLVGFVKNDLAAELDAMVTFGAIPADADLASVAADIEADVGPASLRADADTAALAAAVGRLIRVVAHRGFRLPKELVLFFKNLLYLSGFAAEVAPDARLLGQVLPVFDYFESKYGQAIPLFVGAEAGLDGVAGGGVALDVRDEGEGCDDDATARKESPLTELALNDGLSERASLARLLENHSDEEVEKLTEAVGMGRLLEMVVAALTARFRPDAAAGQDAVVQWDVVDAAGATHSFVLTVADGVCSGAIGTAASPRLTLGMDVPVFLRFLAGTVDPMQAFMSGQLRIVGDLPFSMGFQGWFRTD